MQCFAFSITCAIPLGSSTSLVPCSSPPLMCRINLNVSLSCTQTTTLPSVSGTMCVMNECDVLTVEITTHKKKSLLVLMHVVYFVIS